ncbi:MAG: hypothetical protein J2P47_09920 [Acetobacteraceae bacterium]|nr:hypothetical protein [Acetobacteraceae bacterium]
MRRIVLSLLATLLQAPATMAVAAVPQGCPIPTAATIPDRPLGHLASAIRAGGPVTILAVGSATTKGEDEGSENAFPAHMLTALSQALPAVRFELRTRGGKGTTAAEMLAIIEDELKSRPVPLVVWQTGTVEAVREIRPAELGAVLDRGTAAVRQAGADLVLIGPQFSRALQSRVDLTAYDRVLREAAGRSETAWFPRAALTRKWVELGRIDPERAAKADRETALETQHSCVGAALAHFILAGVGLS